MPQSPCLTAALEYIGRGWSVLPLCSPDHEGVPGAHEKTCTGPGKRPLLTEWKSLQDKIATEALVRTWWSRWPAANVGVILGRVSRIIGLDVDGPAAELLLQRLSGGDVPPTLSFRTPGGGRRLLYTIPPDLVVAKRRYDEGDSHVIILGEGSYTVMPPSRHVLGGSYA